MVVDALTFRLKRNRHRRRFPPADVATSVCVFAVWNRAGSVGLHLLEIILELRAKLRVGDIVDDALDTVLFLYREAATLCPKVRLVISSKEKIRYAVR